MNESEIRQFIPYKKITNFIFLFNSFVNEKKKTKKKNMF